MSFNPVSHKAKRGAMVVEPFWIWEIAYIKLEHTAVADRIMFSPERVPHSKPEDMRMCYLP